MAKVLKATDAVIVGLGWTGAIMARELTRAGLEVLALERGPDRDPAADFALPAIRDELRYSVRQELMQDPKMETVTLRHRLDDEARPVRRFGAFLPGDGVGGMGTHWNGNTFRFLPSDHNLRTHLTERYGRGRIPDDMTIQDWGVTYDELEPHYARFEAICGVSGKAGNIRGRIQAGGNPFEGPRSGEYPNAPLCRLTPTSCSRARRPSSVCTRFRRRPPTPARPTAIRKGPSSEPVNIAVIAIGSDAKRTPRRRR
ncbi:choline dehydrogenase-like flavoprotein [Bradyrhizobium sp. USDA 4448]